MTLNRKAEKEIQRWIQKSDKALIVYGARQVGKTFAIRATLKKNKCNYVEFNLIDDEDVLSILQHFTSVDDLIMKLSLYSDKPLIPHETFIFFDEIQEYPEIVTTIKFLVEDGRFRYVLSGSLLGVEIYNLKSAPVGYLSSLMMYPLDFEEFLQIFHVSDDILSHLENCFETKKEVNDTIHKKLLSLFDLYLLIGGMPKAVSKYKDTNSIDEVMREHRAIIEQYKSDFTKYEEKNKRLFLTKIYEQIPAQLSEKNRRFNVSKVDQNARFDRMEDDFIWLTKAGVALPTYNVTVPLFPLMLNEKMSLFKLFLSDVGLLTTIYGKTTKLRIISQEEDINKGAIYENAVCQELTAHGYPTYYYQNKKLGEVDFVIEKDNAVLPIEVKSGKDYQSHKALDNVISIKEYHLEDAYVFGKCNVSVKEKVTYYPIYMMMYIQDKTQKEETILKIEDYSF